jgi:D-xylose transport system substrate-binding protein
MKKRTLAITMLIAMLVVPAFMAVAGGGGDKGKLIVGLSLPTQREARWVNDKVTMEAEAKKIGLDLRVAISDNNMAQQAAQVENLLSQKIKVLILAPHDATAAGTLVKDAHAEGVPVISYDRLILNAGVDLYISFDNVGVGRLQGEFITKAVPKGAYILLAGAPTDNNAKLFKAGAMEFIQPLIDKGDITVITDQAVDDWNPANAMRIVENALTAANNKVDAILSPNDGCAGGAIEALAAQGLDGKVPVTGQDAQADAAKRILAGTQSMTVYKDTRELGKAAVQQAIKMAKGEKPDTNNVVDGVQSLLLVPYAVDKSNLKEMLVDSGYLKESDVY